MLDGPGDCSVAGARGVPRLAGFGGRAGVSKPREQVVPGLCTLPARMA